MYAKYSLENRPKEFREYLKRTKVRMSFITEPFMVETQEGLMTISPTTVDGWDGGYFIAYPGDGSKPYAIATKHVLDDYIEAK